MILKLYIVYMKLQFTQKIKLIYYIYYLINKEKHEKIY